MGNGRSPRDVLHSLSQSLGISKGDAHYALTRAEKLKNTVPKGVNILHLVLASTFLYVRYGPADRYPIDRLEFCEKCGDIGLKITPRDLSRLSRLYIEKGLYKVTLSPVQLLGRVWKKVGLELNLTDTVREHALQLLSMVNVSGRKPEVPVATAIYLGGIQLGIDLTQKDVARALHVTVVSIRNCLFLFR